MLIVKIQNDKTGTKEIGNYNVSVCVNYKEIWRGRVEGHQRHLPWEDLVLRVLNASHGVPRTIEP